MVILKAEIKLRKLQEIFLEMQSANQIYPNHNEYFTPTNNRGPS